MNDWRNRSGFTLVELIVVIAIAGILATLGTVAFRDMNRKAGVERVAREMLADLNQARSESIFRGKRHSLVIESSAIAYVMRRYSSADEARGSTPPDPATNTNPPYGIIMRKPLSYLLSKEDGTSAANTTFEFDRNGFTTDILNIRVEPVNSGASFDCIVISASRTNIGKMEGGACVQK